MQVCFYRDKNSINKFIVGKVSQAGVEFSEPFAVATEWNYSVMQNPTKFCVGAW
jgi:20S proteasome subunit beta 7